MSQTGHIDRLSLKKMPGLRMRCSVKLVWFAIALALSAGSADACRLIQYADDGRYVGGDLTAQMARKADTIQIMRATARHVVTRTYTLGDWYLNFGNTNAPGWEPEFVDAFVYELSVVETLKGREPPADDPVYEHRPRILAYGAGEFRRNASDAGTPFDGPFDALPDGLLDRPGHDGHVFRTAREHNDILFGDCDQPYIIDIGQTFVALRDSVGRLYPADAGFPLEIDVEFGTKDGPPKRFSFNMQSLVPITGEQDPYLMRLRRALAANGR